MNCKQTSQNILKNLNERTKEVIVRRFALGKNKKQETLESIGQSYKITRERVRQIEKDGIKKSKKAKDDLGIKKEFDEIISFFENEINNCGGVVIEEIIFKKHKLEEEKNHILFLFSLSNKIAKEKEDNKFHSFLTTSKDDAHHAKNTVLDFVKILKKKEVPESIENLYTEYDGKESKEVFSNYLKISKDILKVFDGEKLGLKSWPEVNPKTVKDKIKLILKDNKKPIHFKKIVDMVVSLGDRLPKKRNLHPQTIHNELIRNQDFVLVGRGYYALKDWGYNPGQVKDVIYQVLSASETSLPKEEILNSVLSQRIVKESTVLLNLQNKKYFTRDVEGKYKIKES
jgi:hypothetical protein